MKVVKHDEGFQDVKKDVFKEFYLESTEVYEDDVVIIDGKGRIMGNVEGDVVAIFSDVEFSGNVEGDFVSIGGTLKVSSGSVEGAMVLIASKSSGEFGYIEGDFVRINFPLLSALLRAFKPMIIKRALQEKEVREYEEFVVKENESFNMERVKLKAKRVVVEGSLKVDSLEVEKEVIVSGDLRTGAVSCRDLHVSGNVRAGAIKAGRSVKVEGSGRITSGAVNCKAVVVDKGGIIKSGAVNADEWEVEGRIVSPTAIFKRF